VLLIIGAWEVYDHVVGSTAFEVGTQPFATHLVGRLQQRIDRNRSTGAPTVLAMVPCFGPNASRLGDERLDPERIAWVNDVIRTAAKRNRGWVRTIDPASVLCAPDGRSRPANEAGLSIREDGAHFDTEAAVWFWNTWLAEQLGAALAVPSAAGASG